MEFEELTYNVRNAIFLVAKELDPGLLESVYEAALAHELESQGFGVRRQVGLPVGYKEVHLELGFRIDLIVNDLVIIEVKSVEMLHDVHKKQLLTYLKLSKRKIGFLVNFNSCFLDKQSFIRIVN
jgi:GxxExxY protein